MQGDSVMTCRRYSFWVSGPNYQGAAAIGGLVALPFMAVNGPAAAAMFVVVAGLVWWRSARQGVEVCAGEGSVLLHGWLHSRVVRADEFDSLCWVPRWGDLRLVAQVGDRRWLLPGVGLPLSGQWGGRDQLWLSRCREFVDELGEAGVDPAVLSAVRSRIESGGERSG